MIENTAFNNDWNKLQKAFWDNVGANFLESSDNTSCDDNAAKAQTSTFLNQWLMDVDECWQDHAQNISPDIDSLYNKISSSSRFFINFTESVSVKVQGETTDELITKILEGLNTTSSNNNTDDRDNSSNMAFWNLPPAFIAQQQQSFSTLASLFKDAANNPDFSAAVKSYLKALTKYQLVIFNLLKATVVHVLDVLKVKSEKTTSPMQIMTLCLEVLEANYLLLISEDSYSQAYADVINSWMLMLSKSNKPYTEFIQASMSSTQFDPDGPTHAK